MNAKVRVGVRVVMYMFEYIMCVFDDQMCTFGYLILDVILSLVSSQNITWKLGILHILEMLVVLVNCNKDWKDSSI